MACYVGFVMLLNLAVCYLLLLGTNCLCGHPLDGKRALTGAAVSSAYSGVCLLPAPAWIGSMALRLLVLALTAVMTFGLDRRAIFRSAVYMLLMLAVGLLTSGFDKVGGAELMTAVICIVALLLLRSEKNPSYLVTMDLQYGGKQMCVKALADTGNGLRDPVTGESVIVVSPDVAGVFTGLTRKQLSSPLDSLHLIPGLRLIPYRTVGKERGFMLALRFENVKIGNRSGNWLVAFAPEGLGAEGRFQALTGRTI